MRLEDGHGNEVELLQVQEDRDSTQSNVDVFEAPTFEAAEAILLSLTRQRRAELQGIATGSRLARMEGYPDDRLQALAEWVQLLMAFNSPFQGDGHALVHEERGFEAGVVVTDTSWTRNAGDANEVLWNATIEQGEGIMQDRPVEPGEAAPQTAWSLSGPDGSMDLHSPTTYSETAQQRVDITEMLLAADADENIVVAQGGVVRRINIQGRVPEPERAAFDAFMQEASGQNQEMTYQSAFPGHALGCMVEDFDSTLEAGVTSLGEYRLSLVQGHGV